MKNNRNKIIGIIIACLTAVIILLECYTNYKETGQVDANKISEAVSTVVDELRTYEMTEQEIKELPSTEIIEQTEEQENTQEQEVESEGFELQGEIAYEGDRATTWDIELGDYKGLTYYSQLDSRWANKMYSSVNDASQTIGSSGCRSDLRCNDSNSL